MKLVRELMEEKRKDAGVYENSEPRRSAVLEGMIQGGQLRNALA